MLWLIFLAAATLAVAFVSLFSGQAKISPADILTIIRHGQQNIHYNILLNIRLPRIVLALAVGSGLALSGVLLQGMFRNPLVEPYTLGISGGAALGVCVGIILKASRLLGPATLPLFGFTGAMCALVFVYRAGMRRGTLKTQWLLLTGVMVSFFSSSLIMLIMALARKEDLYAIVFWTMGSLDQNNWTTIIIPLTLSFASLVLAYCFHPHLNALSLGEEEAMHLGINTQRIRRIFFVLASVLSGVCVASAGIIGFVGLAVPHMIRLVVGSDARVLLGGSWLAGAGFLVLSDLLARSIAAPVELPVGIVTGIVGGGFFVYALSKTDKQ